MKKIICIFLCILLIFMLSACVESAATQSGLFFNNGQRFILVDESPNSGLPADVSIYYDSVTGVLYMYIDGCYNGGITPLYNSDGSLMLYDEG